MQTRRLTTLVIVLAAGFGSLAAAGATPPDVPVSYLFSPAGHLTSLRTGVVYQASDFPIPLRVAPPDGSWGGAQWKANQFSPDEIAQKHLTCSTNPKVCAPPYYGWVTLGQGFSKVNAPPRSLIIVMSSFSRTPSVAATVANLHRGNDVDYQPASRVKLGGFGGVAFDGQTAGAKHLFIPFTPSSHKAAGDGGRRSDRNRRAGPSFPLRRPQRPWKNCGRPDQQPRHDGRPVRGLPSEGGCDPEDAPLPGLEALRP